MPYVTENDIRKRLGSENGGELLLQAEERLTPSARDFVQSRHARIVIMDAANPDANPNGKRRNPLCLYEEEPRPMQEGISGKPGNLDSAGRGSQGNLGNVNLGNLGRKSLNSLGNPANRNAENQNAESSGKPEHMTHLDGSHLVPKTDPRIEFRGKLDSLTAAIVLVQNEIVVSLKEKIRDFVLSSLSDLRSWTGYILRCGVTGESLPVLTMGKLDFCRIREISHHPLRCLGHDHIVPEYSQGMACARLNMLRAQARETELAAVRLYMDETGQISRKDLVLALNRMSSALYILMILTTADYSGVLFKEPH